jgi:hypothetical protein
LKVLPEVKPWVRLNKIRRLDVMNVLATAELMVLVGDAESLEGFA